jgi:hypothetical protein
MSQVGKPHMQSDNNKLLDIFSTSCPAAKIARGVMLAGLLACGVGGPGGCAAYTPAGATVPIDQPARLVGREDAIEAAMRAAARHQELTVVGRPVVTGDEMKFAILGSGEEHGTAVVTRVRDVAVAAGECCVMVTAQISMDADGARAGRLVADFRQRWEQLRQTGFAPLPLGWQ